MQPPRLTGQSDTRNLVEDMHNLLGVVARGWRLIALCVAIALALAVIYLAGARPAYQASARLLVIQHGGRPLNLSIGPDSLLQSADGSSSLATHVMIIRSPLIVGRALASAGLNDLSAGSVLGRLTVKLPDPTARVLEIGYKAGSSDEAVRVIDSVIKSYDLFLRENYQRNSTQVLDLITKARDELAADLKMLEKEYLEFREKGGVARPGGESKLFVARRLDQWDEAINRAMLRSLELKSQIDLGRRLAEEGAGVDLITSVLGYLGGTPISPGPGPADPGAPSGLSPDRLEAQLGEIEFQRQTAEGVLEHLRDETDKAVSGARARVGESEVARAFYAMPEVAACAEDLRRTREAYDHDRAVSRRTDEAAIVSLGKRMKALQAELDRLWQLHRPAIQDRLAGGDDGEAIRRAEGEVIALRAKEAALRERLERFRADRVAELEARRDRLVQRHGPPEKVQELEEQIARLRGDANEAPADPRQAQAAALLKAIEHGLKSVEAVRAEFEQRFRQDLAESNKSEIGLLAESNLRNDLERRRALFYSVVNQLKQAQLVSDFASVTEQVLDPPAAAESRRPIAVVLLAALVVGCGLGAGAAYVADQFDARVRSLPEIRRLLDYRVLGAVPLLSRAEQGGVPVGLISLMKPRSRAAEIYKSIRTGIDLIRRNWDGKVFMVTSPKPADGKSTTASNLAICTARSGRRVLLVDADLRGPFQHAIYDHPRSPGLTQVLMDRITVREAVHATEVENLDLLTAGEEVDYPAELLATGRLAALVGELRRAYDLVVIDSSPLLAVTDPSVIAVTIDGIVLVVRAAATRRLDIERSQDLLGALETPVLGLVINGLCAGRGDYGFGYGAYGPAGPAGGRRELPRVGPDGTDGRPRSDA